MNRINRGIGVFCCLVGALILYGCSSNYAKYIPGGSDGSHQLRGQASWYGPGFHGKQTASGERFNQNAMTAAHKTLPFGTLVRVTNLNNGRSVEVVINDRGPFVRGRIIDMSKGAARRIDMIGEGVVPVKIDILRYGG